MIVRIGFHSFAHFKKRYLMKDVVSSIIQRRQDSNTTPYNNCVVETNLNIRISQLPTVSCEYYQCVIEGHIANVFLRPDPLI